MQELFATLMTPLVGFLLKLTALLATAAFGLMGVGVITRDDAGRLTRHGRIALVGVVVAAALSVATLVYEFAIQQNEAESSRRRSEQLLLSVYRGLYPLRGASVEAVIQVGDFDALRMVRERLRRLADAANDGSSTYDLHDSSLVMDRRRDKLVASVIGGLYVHVALYRWATESERRARGCVRSAGELWTPATVCSATYVGRFFVDVDDAAQTTLRYDRENKTMSVVIKKDLDDKRLTEAGTYSLVDMLPGYAKATPNIKASGICETPGLPECHSAFNGAYSGLTLTEIRISFEYPKIIRMDSYSEDSRCPASEGNGTGMALAVALPHIDVLDSLGNVPEDVRNAKPSACQIIADTPLQ